MADENPKRSSGNEEKIIDSTKAQISLPVDEKKVQTAVKFLQNPKVRVTDFERRISFLKNKGLNEKEIDLALKRSDTEKDKETPYQPAATTSVKASALSGDERPAKVEVQRTSPASFISYLASVIIGGGIVYSAGYLLQKYIFPYLFDKEENDTKQLQKGIRELTEGVNALSIISSYSQESFKEQQSLLKSVNDELAVTKARVDLVPSDVTNLSDLKTEISSVKGLLLGRRQFPQSPFVAPSGGSPSIPAWQKASSIKKIEKESEQKSNENEVETSSRSKSPSDEEFSEVQEHPTQRESDDSSSNVATPGENSINQPDDSKSTDDQGVNVSNESSPLSSTYVKLDADS
eukprot:gene15327-16904_t